MKFCAYCGSNLTKSTATGVIVFSCRCQVQVNGDPEDTLMAEGLIETSESNIRHEVFIDNAPHDLAGNIVMKDCPDCGLDILTMIRIGAQEVVMYSCSCGFRATHEAYVKQMEVKNKKSDNEVEAK